MKSYHDCDGLQRHTHILMVCEREFSGALWTSMLKWLRKDGFQKAGEKSRGKWAVTNGKLALEVGSPKGFPTPVSAVREILHSLDMLL